MSNRSLKGLAAVLIVVLAIAGLAVIPAMAEEEETTPTPPKSFLARVSDHLGVSVDDLESAITAAKIEMIDEAVAQGRITQEQAERIIGRIGEGGGLWCPGGRGFRAADGLNVGIVERLAAAVEAGKITQDQADQIMERLDDGRGFHRPGFRGWPMGNFWGLQR
ncbi:MAG: hypothetical protein AAGB97_05250 [Dehalococcoidia bacterium]|nr:hypothetical protein [Chloroflexota bacterium]MBT9159368.1 hypothetical protein [Chloroflexota bacterium]MBT9162590.1 hypothetical protein [Chloroflexota bacterium]